jgi:hypothetical protein
MPLNLKKIQSLARRRLGLKGEIEFRRARVPNRFVLATSTDAETLRHVVAYSDSSSLEEADVYHELCRAKAYELGFAGAETLALNAMRDCSKEDPKYIADANAAAVVASEVYANCLLFLRFPEESAARREELLRSFETTDALTGLDTRMGFWGLAGMAYYRLACERTGNTFPTDRIDKAIDRSPQASSIRRAYTHSYSILSELPQIKTDGEIEAFDEVERARIAEAIVRLFSAKTGLECGK